jgi:serine/threonine protein kinase/tetratricopeptide (TPR) repeat protein
VAPTLREGPGTKIGPYRILQLIGEGGFGSVFMAEQEQPVQRRVALKIIKLGMDTRQVVARFEQERQALAILDHPSIAKVLDAGATETGRPYFVMELCRGEPIDEYCDHNQLSIPDRLELFVQVCEAVQHAHTKGLIHRDIKPSNVLVSAHDGRAVAKIIDFGIAKATASKLTEKTLFTQQRQLIGTPEYMSPEQAEGSLDIDTRTDVYALGVVLYELLTGTTPFSGKDLRSAAYGEVQRIIREVEPPRPSTRLSQNADTIAGVAARRHTEPRRLNILVRGELDWIVMKTLEKDRQRRYETANGLAMDIKRYLAGEAVLAAPPSSAYRFRKFVRRHRGPVIAAGGVAAALVLGLAGTIWQAGVASHQRDKARSEAARADERAAAAREAETEQRRLAVAEAQQRSLASEQRDRAVAAEAEAHRRADDLQKVADFQGQMLAQVDPTVAGIHLAEDVRARFDAALAKSGLAEGERAAQVDAFVGQWSRVNATDTALELIDRTILKPAVAAIDEQFVEQPVVAASLRHVLAERYHDLGLDAAALALEERALAERRRVLGEEHSDTLQSIGNVGVYLSALDKKAEAESYYREALEKSRRVRGDDDPQTLLCIANLASLFLDKGLYSEAEPYYREALERRRRVLGEEHADTLSSLNDWANLLKEQGKLSDAEGFFREALAKRRRALGEEHRDTLKSLNDLAVVLKSEGKLEESIECLREVTEKKRRILGEMHPSTLLSIQSLGAVLDAAGHPAEAESLMREALAKQQQLLGPDHASTLVTLGNLCVFLIGQNKFAQAEPLCRETLERRERVLGPNHTATLIARNVMGLVLGREGKFADAEPYWRDTLTISRRVLGPAHPDTLTYAHNLARLDLDLKKDAEAEQLFREVIELGSPALGAEHPIVLSATRNLGAMLVQQKRYPEAEALLSAAEAAARKSYTGPSERFLAALLKDLGVARAGLDRFAQAEPNLIEAHAKFAKTRGPSHADTRASTQALVDLYTAWDKAEPAKGHDAQAAEWRTKLEDAK